MRRKPLGGLRDAEVEKLHLPLEGHHHVVRRDIAMDDTQGLAPKVGELVGVVQGIEGVA